jgi:adenylosuccinate synthase
MKTTKIEAVVDWGFGDAGKGRTTQWRVEEALKQGRFPLVIRYSGGPQSGHRVLHNGVEHVCALTGSGVLLGVPTLLNRDVYVNPISLKNEIQVLLDKGINPEVYVDYRCRVITPYDIVRDAYDVRVKQHGSCGCGIHSTFKRYLKNPDFPKLAFALGYPRPFLDKIGSYDPTLCDNFIDACKWLTDHISFAVLENLYDYDTLIFEGSQGLLLDMDNGFMPHCTPSRVGLNGIPETYLDDAEVFLVTRSYLTRHGNGYEPQFEDYIRSNFKNLDEPTNRDDGAQGRFKIGMMNLDLMRDAFSRHRLDNFARMNGVKYNLVITHMDCVNGESIPVISGGHRTFVHPGDIIFDLIKFENTYLSYGPDAEFEQIEVILFLT